MDMRLELTALSEYMKAHFASAPGCHDFDHTMRVAALAEELCLRLPEADSSVVRAAALLHDIARPEEIASQGKICHARRGAELAHQLLAEQGFSAEFASEVAEAVRTHRFRDEEAPRTLEAKILFDADKLDSLGAVGLGRAFLFAGRTGARLHNTSGEALGGAPYSREDTAYREYLVKLSRLPAAMLTLPGRREARKRVRFMRSFFRRMEREISGISGVKA